MSHPQPIVESLAPPTFRATQADLIFSLRERVQNPPPGAFAMDDLVWTNHVTQGQGTHKNSKLAVILWDRLQDFIQGEQQHPQFPCNFTKEIIRVNLPHSLRTPRAHSPAIVLRFDLLPSLRLLAHTDHVLHVCSSKCVLHANTQNCRTQSKISFPCFFAGTGATLALKIRVT